MEGKEHVDVSDLCTFNDTPRAKKLKEDIGWLRKKSKENQMKIKRTQTKIRRTLHKQVSLYLPTINFMVE